jgi:hypothetical protein
VLLVGFSNCTVDTVRVYRDGAQPCRDGADHSRADALLSPTSSCMDARHVGGLAGTHSPLRYAAFAYVVYGLFIGVCTCIPDTVGWLRDGGLHSRVGVSVFPFSSRMDGGNGGGCLYDGPLFRWRPMPLCCCDVCGVYKLYGLHIWGAQGWG